ncbi:hypothetical protein [Microbacterium sp.]|nr:hypothetical protein [Microbacterium sp.]
MNRPAVGYLRRCAARHDADARSFDLVDDYDPRSEPEPITEAICILGYD